MRNQLINHQTYYIDYVTCEYKNLLHFKMRKCFHIIPIEAKEPNHNESFDLQDH